MKTTLEKYNIGQTWFGLFAYIHCWNLLDNVDIKLHLQTFFYHGTYVQLIDVRNKNEDSENWFLRCKGRFNLHSVERFQMMHTENKIYSFLARLHFISFFRFLPLVMPAGSEEAINLNTLRTFRVLRPLKLVSGVPSKLLEAHHHSFYCLNTFNYHNLAVFDILSPNVRL